MVILIALLTTPFLDPAGGPLRSAQAEEAEEAEEAADPMTNPMVRQVIEQLREKTGQIPDSQAIVKALNRHKLSEYVANGIFKEVICDD